MVLLRVFGPGVAFWVVGRRFRQQPSLSGRELWNALVWGRAPRRGERDVPARLVRIGVGLALAAAILVHLSPPVLAVPVFRAALFVCRAVAE